jgi:5,10-methylenetetrahydromethanopterin reductase
MKVAIGFNADIPVEQLIEEARVAERVGFEALFMHEHSFGRDALSYLNALALSTSRIRLGVACLTPYTRHPVVLAVSMATLQETSGGRALLGLGTGFPMRLDLMGIRHDKPIGALKETIEICRGVWTGAPVNYSGVNFTVKNVKSLSGAVAKRIPVYIAGWKRQMLALTGKMADGYVAKGGESVQSIRQIVTSIQSAAARHGRRLSEIELCAYLLTYVGESKEQALKAARTDPFVNYMLSVQDDYLYEGTGIDPAKKKPIAENYFKGNIAASSSFITDEMLEAFVLVGNSEQVCDRVEQFLDAGLALPILQPISMKIPDIERVMRVGEMLVGRREESSAAIGA